MNIKLLDKLVKNGNCFDKMNCVDLKYGLDVLVHEEGFGIREYIASKGYCLDVLVNDEDGYVRAYALENMDILTRTKTNP